MSIHHDALPPPGSSASASAVIPVVDGLGTVVVGVLTVVTVEVGDDSSSLAVVTTFEGMGNTD